jgi:Tol biopolymer transport system component
MCAVGTDQATARAKQPAAPVEFADDGGPTSGTPQNINVFGEINGNHSTAGFLVSEVGFQQHTFTDEGFDSDVCVDSTGKWMVFASTRNSEHPGLYLQRVDGTAVTQLTSDGADDAYPVFSPDGKQIAFSSTRTGQWQIYVIDVDGRNATQVTSGPSQSIHPSWSPDGSRLVYSSLSSRSGQWELWTVDLNTSENRTIGNGLFPVWSPDRTHDRIAFQRARQRGSRWFSLWTLELNNGEARRVTEVAVSANAAIITPTWSPDGKRLAFTTIVQPARTTAGRMKGQTDIWTIDADGSNRQRLTDGRAANLTPFWAADGRVYFISDRGGAECVWSVRGDTVKDTAIVKASNEKETKDGKEAKEPAKEVVGSTDNGEVGH